MTSLFTVMIILLAFFILLALAIIDLKTFLLPNQLVAAFALLGMAFHINTGWAILSPGNAVAGALTGGGFLFLIGWAAHHFYKPDSLGFGDVKLVAAGGLWLGLPAILLGISLGALFGLLHGAVVYTKQKKDGPTVGFGNTVIPAGPGFALGLVTAAVLEWGIFFF